ncbi:hypothetical protein [Streptomyces sp. Da 82-17]|uniref:hypothetical protein n=1 Tax=Streptomyces sp. Da 82-17 TaxID=3377116 RepID=UPI0038D38A0F
MRLRTAPALGLTAAALAVASAAVPAEAYEGAPYRAVAREVTCDEGRGADFPVTSRLRGGPDAYHPGDRPRSFELELANTGKRTCGDIHPVVVLLDRERELRPGQLRLEFRDPDGHWHPVPFERTDEDENVGVFDDGFTGFSLAPGASVTVPVRLAFAADAGENEVTVQVAVVQRRDGDGDWVGQSGAYTFSLGADPASDGTGGMRPPSELAATGPLRGRVLVGYGIAAGLLVAGGVALVRGARRMRGRRAAHL